MLVALVLTVLVTIIALVIDLSLVRQNRQADKSATDFAAAAGIRSLDNGAGLVQVWKGICVARDYLVSNNSELASLTFADATWNPAPLGADPCELPVLPPTICAAPGTWGTYRGIADGGRIRVTIQNGYDLTSSGFPEDADEYSGDSSGDPCDYLAVIIEESEDAAFGGIVGSDGHTSTIRSVARLVRSGDPVSTAALVLLERTECNALQIEGGSGANVFVAGLGPDPGIIHADSLGNGSTCSSSSTIFDVNGASTPVIVAGRSQTPVGSEAAGQIRSVALSDAPGANTAYVAAAPPRVCAQILATDCVGANGGGPPTANDLVGRGPADERYRTHIISLRDEANTRFGWNAAAANAAGFTEVSGAGCSAPIPAAATKIWVNCDPFDGNGKVFGVNVQEVVVNGRLVVTSGVLQVASPTKFYVKGTTSASDYGIYLNGPGSIRVNDGTSVNCTARHIANSSAVSRMVLGNGRLVVNGGPGSTLRLCQTVVLLADSNASGCPIPTSDGVAPYDNSCRGNIRVGGQASVDWSAPNVNDVSAPTSAQLANFEDLALWSETKACAQGEPGCQDNHQHNVAGQGNLTMAGIFFTPNAAPFRVAGNGFQNTTDAQFFTRRLQVAGQGQFRMSPQPQNAIGIPVLGGYTLVR